MTRLDETFRPDPSCNENTITPPRELRIYESSVPGCVTVIVEGFLPVGLRLSETQVIRLYAVLGQHLGMGDLLLRYSEWLDINGLLANPSDLDERTHDDLSSEFLTEVLAA